MQRSDFTEIFRIMKGLPVTIRLLDPPLHEFLPKTEPEFQELAQLSGKSVAEVRHRTHALHETNPMLGHRGCRLGITYPEIYETQAVAIFEAAAAVMQETGEAVEPEIMVPLIATRRELDILK
jgi:pyruvate, orthophosphate dikinase